MAQKPARIESPEVIKGFRNRFVIFDQECRNALMGCAADVTSTTEWLRSEQRLYWKNQLRKREEELNVAQREHSQAQWAAGRGGRSSAVEELRALHRAKRRKEEVEQKINAVKKWSALLDQKTSKMMGPVNALTILLDQRTPQVMARLDRMLDSLEEYFRQSPTEAS